MPTPSVPSFSLLDAEQAAAAPRPDDLELAISQVEGAFLASEEELAAAVAPSEPPAVDPGLDQARSRILDFCRAHPDALHRSCLDGHLTGSAVVIDAKRGKALLLHHAKLDRWLQPGGHADGDGNLASVALREAQEETGLDGLQVVTPAIDVDVHSIPERGSEPEHVHLDVRFLVLAPPDSEAVINHESLGSRWVGLDAPELAHAGELQRLVRRGFALSEVLTRDWAEGAT